MICYDLTLNKIHQTAYKKQSNYKLQLNIDNLSKFIDSYNNYVVLNKRCPNKARLICDCFNNSKPLCNNHFWEHKRHVDCQNEPNDQNAPINQETKQ